MIKINKSEEPNCLKLLRDDPDTTYDDLSRNKDCNEEVRKLLSTDQNGLCAYCQREFDSKIFIEHYIAQADPKQGKELDLSYSNFLGVCSGKYYVDRKTGEKILFCSVNRGSSSLKINPESQDDVDTLFYDKESRIKSTDPIYQHELDVILNLNFDDLCLDRQIMFEEELKIIQETAISMGLSPLETYSKAIKSVALRNPKFSGLLLYRLKNLLDYHSDIK